MFTLSEGLGSEFICMCIWVARLPSSLGYNTFCISIKNGFKNFDKSMWKYYSAYSILVKSSKLHNRKSIITINRNYLKYELNWCIEQWHTCNDD